nr:hypothetical protein [uncultured Albidiferax sp.]
MASPKTHADKTNAADKSIGFDYQYYYFLLKALNLKVNQSVGLEVKDDVHTEINQSINIFYQLKHTTQTAADGTPVALTRLDKDLWKTLYNWAMVISDEASGRKEISAQLDFTRRSEFHLVANKKRSFTNSVLVAIEQLQSHKIDIREAKTELEDAKNSTLDDDIKKYIEKVLALDTAVLENYLRQIQFELEVDNIVDLVRQAVHEFHVDKEKIQSVLHSIDSNLREYVFNTVKSGKPVTLTFEEFHARVRRFIQDARSTKLTVKAFTPALPPDLFTQVFIKRLVEINAILPGDVEWAAELTVFKLQLALHIEEWEKTGEVTSRDIAELHDEVRTAWKNKFRLKYVGCAESDIERIGRELLNEMLASKYALSDDVLTLPHSNGEIYHLSDLGRIGWHKQWDTK